jgi:nucleoside-diphosphate-sugar epimerase
VAGNNGMAGSAIVRRLRQERCEVLVAERREPRSHAPRANQWYAIAKISAGKLCEAYRRQYGSDFISVMPTNLYGPGDNYHPEHSHVVPALIRRFHEAKVADASTVVI